MVIVVVVAVVVARGGGSSGREQRERAAGESSGRVNLGTKGGKQANGRRGGEAGERSSVCVCVGVRGARGGDRNNFVWANSTIDAWRRVNRALPRGSLGCG
jgi:hypothetical protein